MKIHIILFAILAYFSGLYLGTEAKEDKSVTGIRMYQIVGNELKSKGACTAFLYGGYTITNSHCIQDTDLIKTINGKRIKLLLHDPVSDIAILESYGGTKELDRGSVEVGGDVRVLSYRPRFEGLLTDGILSKIDGTMLLFTARIAQGFSGSPVLNRKGDVVGVVHGYYILDSTQMGAGTSIDVVDELIDLIKVKKSSQSGVRYIPFTVK